MQSIAVTGWWAGLGWFIVPNYIIKLYRMKERYAYSPKDARLIDRYDINFKKSPQKFVMYQSPQTPQDLHKDRPTFTSHFQAEQVKKLPEETAALRQTMNSKFLSKLQKGLQQQKGNKLNDFLRQTMSSKTSRPYSDSLIPDQAYSGQVYQKEENSKYSDTYRGKAIDSSSSIKEYERLNDKINRNKQIIEQLRKSNRQKQGKDLLRNVNQHRSPTFLHVDSEKEQPVRSSKDINNYYLTPKIDKGNYQSRFNSSPLIQPPNLKSKAHEEPNIVTLAAIASSPKRKIASIATKGGIIDDLIIDKKLGQGKFGCVNLVKHRKTNSIFALKKIPKALIKSNMMIDQLALEIRIQSCIKHGNILEMYGCFDDKTHLYIMLEYMNGGTLYQKLKKERLQEAEVSSIVRQITSAIDYLHDIGIAHRDIKPENIVISNDVYKLCDFGWAAICDQRRKTYCGTFDYVAPEILQGVEYDMTVDLWCLGVLTYELLTGKVPFYHISRKETMKKILNVQNQILVFPEGMSDNAKDFIDKLIRKNPLERIKASEALLHPFLKEEEEG